MEEAEAGSSKILKEAEAFWQNKLEVEANLEATNFIPSRKREAEVKNLKSEEAEANSEAWHFKRSWKQKQKIFYCFHIPVTNSQVNLFFKI